MVINIIIENLVISHLLMLLDPLCFNLRDLALHLLVLPLKVRNIFMYLYLDKVSFLPDISCNIIIHHIL